jgi:glycosyltransferase involved in cell wall biosynthesis
VKRVLVIAWDFPPQGASSAIRASKLVKYLPEFGWWPTVVCPDLVTQYDPTLLVDIPAGVAVHRVPGPRRLFAAGIGAARGPLPRAGQAAPLWQRMVRRTRGAVRPVLFPDPQVLWLPQLRAGIEQAIAAVQPDVLFTTALPFTIALAGLLTKRHHPGLSWVCDFRDVWSLRSDGYRRRAGVWLERRCYDAAEATVYLTRGQRRFAMRAMRRTGDRAHVIPNGVDPADFQYLSLHHPRNEGGQLVLTHTGTVVGDRFTDSFLSALQHLSRLRPVAGRLKVRLMGNLLHPNTALIDSLIAQGILEVRPFGDYAESLRLQGQSDALLLLAAPTIQARTSHPNKLFEYLATGHPILAIVPEGDIARLIRERRAGVVIRPLDSGSIVRTLCAWTEQHARGCWSRRTSVDDYRQFHRREIARTMASLFDRIVRA